MRLVAVKENTSQTGTEGTARDIEAKFLPLELRQK